MTAALLDRGTHSAVARDSVWRNGPCDADWGATGMHRSVLVGKAHAVLRYHYLSQRLEPQPLQVPQGPIRIYRACGARLDDALMILRRKGPFKKYMIPLLKVLFGCMYAKEGAFEAVTVPDDLGGR